MKMPVQMTKQMTKGKMMSKAKKGKSKKVALGMKKYPGKRGKK